MENVTSLDMSYCMVKGSEETIWDLKYHPTEQ